MNTGPESPEAVHRFWFADAIEDPRAAEARHDVWFETSAEFDAAIRQRFVPTMEAAVRGALADWKRVPQSCVALVIVLDQFPRNVYRGTPAAFACDARALEVTRRAIAAGYWEHLSIMERTFLLMPYEHVEDVAAQREGLPLFERLHAEAPASWRNVTGNTLAYARSHLAIVERFGRFPHRNAILGRTSTDAEREYLASNDETFGQGTAG